MTKRAATRFFWAITLFSFGLGCAEEEGTGGQTPGDAADEDSAGPDGVGPDASEPDGQAEDSGSEGGDVGDTSDGGGEGGSDVSPDEDSGGTEWEWPVEREPVSITPHESWKNEIVWDTSELFTNWGSGEFGGQPRWVKFTVLMKDPDKIYFQNSNIYPFHGPFAAERLDPFLGLAQSEYDARTLYAQGQEAILGAVLMPPAGDGPAELAVQLVRRDPYEKEMVRYVVERVAQNVSHSVPLTVLYFPTFEQREQAEQDAEWFAGNGIQVSNAERWVGGNTCYAGGWAAGRLVQVAPEDIDDAFAAGTLLAGDILLTDGVPAEVPVLAGIVTLEPSTPNSHVAILANNFGLPFVYAASDALRDKLAAQVGLRTILRTSVEPWSGACKIEVEDATGLNSAVWDGLLALKVPPKLDIAPKEHLGEVAAWTQDLVPSDVRFFGGKATNFAVLRAAIPQNSPEAMALSFDVFDALLAQPHAGGQTLGQAIESRLSPFGWPTDLAALDAALAEVRGWVQEAEFPADVAQAVTNALAPFDPKLRLRFRSSTNVEDSALFTGAGLYDSASGCLADELDGDDTGPSQCDASEPKERGIFRALRKVYASFWNKNAFIERRKRQVVEGDAGMAVLVHHSFPDEIEAANGVATVRKDDWVNAATLITQLGAVSVTNPEGGALPESVLASYGGDGTVYLSLQAPSSLVPLGGTVLQWQDDYLELASLLDQVRKRWEVVTEVSSGYMLDLEYKKVSHGRGEPLQIKQVREVPLPAATVGNRIQVGDTLALCTFQGEYGDVFGNHRLKGRFELTARQGELSLDAPASLAHSAEVSLLIGGEVAELQGVVSQWPGAETHADDNAVITVFTATSPAGVSKLRLRAEVPDANPGQGPVFFLRDARWFLEVEHPAPVLVVDWSGESSWVQTEAVQLVGCPEPTAGLLPQTRVASAQRFEVRVEYTWPPYPGGIVAGYTAPVHEFTKTTLTGFVDQPVVLTGWYSQTYRPGHHNFDEHFLFEPRLEPGLSAEVVGAFDALGARQILVRVASGDAEIYLVSAEGEVKEYAAVGGK
jgi:hypothetical protein